MLSGTKFVSRFSHGFWNTNSSSLDFTISFFDSCWIAVTSANDSIKLFYELGLMPIIFKLPDTYSGKVVKSGHWFYLLKTTNYHSLLECSYSFYILIIFHPSFFFERKSIWRIVFIHYEFDCTLLLAFSIGLFWFTFFPRFFFFFQFIGEIEAVSCASDCWQVSYFASQSLHRFLLYYVIFIVSYYSCFILFVCFLLGVILSIISVI